MGEGGYIQINKSLNADAFDEYLSTQQSLLPFLPDVGRISPLVTRVLGFNPGKVSNIGVRFSELGPSHSVGQLSLLALAALTLRIPNWAQALSNILTEQNIAISHVLLTHWHGDHTGGVPDLIRLYPPLGTAIYKNAPGEGQLPINDHQIFVVEGATIQAVHSPGHSHDHMCFILREENAMFTGDNILGNDVSSGVEDLGVDMNTLTVMQKHDCVLGYPAHGVVVADLRAKIAQVIGQKVRREQKLLRKMQALWVAATNGGKRSGIGSATVEELVIATYGEGVGTVTREQILELFTDEILRKLAGDGKVGFEVVGREKR
uniref:Putative metallo-beta-lactamase n=1 Tax=Cladonia uncialis subsp. uncialis TaxID=180999 RepID=A0A1Z1CE06_CLAUC|nr:putative metallo-beta-lactamase [Cladonia uncialis subsp. uncialis]AUW31255.1 putative metallo-beta-lactamase [Cladonia uncialis subsp. uncialis]